MRSRDSTGRRGLAGRRGLERGLRVAGTAAAALLIMRAGRPTPAAEGLATGSGALDSALVSWTLGAPGRVALVSDIAPRQRQRDWLVALRRVGTSIRWRLRDSSGARGRALVVEPVATPEGRARLVVAAGPGDPFRLTDALGAMDTARIGDSGAMTLSTPIAGVVEATLPGAMPAGALRDTVLLRPVLVLGAAGWESKFVIAALEEAGWSVRARLYVAPGATVEQGGGLGAALDTAQLGAVILLDSTAAPPVAALRRFVLSGGGLIVAASASAISGIDALLPAHGGARRAGVVGGLQGPDPRAGLAATAFNGVSPQAVPLERRGGSPVLLARRVGAGRVLLVGYDEMWRWRMMAANENAPDAHRAWWSGAVSSVAHAALLPIDATVADGAPFAASVDALGAPSIVATNPPAIPASFIDAVLFAFVVLGLLGEWLSRRLRGEP